MDAPQQHGSSLLRSFDTPYQPSAWICCVLIFWTGTCIFRDLSVPEPWIGIVFTVTTYVPTIFSAGKSILRGSRREPGAHDAVATSRVRAWRASLIATAWIITAIARAVLRKWPDKFRIAHVPLRQILCVVIFLGLRHAFDQGARKVRGGISLPANNDEEHATHPVPVNAYVHPSLETDQTQGTDRFPREAATEYSAADAGMHMYRPLDTLLVLSIALCILSFVGEGLFFPYGFYTLPRVTGGIFQATIPTIIFHIYMLARPDSELALQTQFVNDANFSLELTALWVSTRPFILLSIGYIAGLLEVLVLSYMSVLYALGLWKVLPRFAQSL